MVFRVDDIFESYPKITESPRQWGLEPAQRRALDRVDWLVTEKIHGANFCILLGPQAQRHAAKRKALLGPDEDFFHHRAVLERLAPALAALDAALRRHDDDWIVLYGELFGGGYPHADVPAVDDVSPIQTGVYYAPDVRFCVFDLGYGSHEEPGLAIMAPHEAYAHAEEAGLMAVEILHRGSLRSCLDYPVDFESTIPARLGLPAIEDNPSEGVVLRPAETLWIEGRKGPFRPLLKCKPASFAEDARFHQAQPWPARAARARGHELDLLEWEMRSRLNVNRLDAARSKIGHIDSPERRHDLAALVIDDIWDELARDFASDVAALTTLERELLREVLADEAAASIEANLPISHKRDS